VRVSRDGGRTPKWRGDGRELFYRSDDEQLMAVDIWEAASGLEVGRTWSSPAHPPSAGPCLTRTWLHIQCRAEGTRAVAERIDVVERGAEDSAGGEVGWSAIVEADVFLDDLDREAVLIRHGVVDPLAQIAHRCD